MQKSDYQKQLLETCTYFKVPEDVVTNLTKSTANNALVRQVFYTLCLRDKINLYKLAICLNKHRTTIIKQMRSVKHDVSDIVNNIIKNRVQEIPANAIDPELITCVSLPNQ